MGISMSGLQLIETLKASGAEDVFFERWAGQFAKTNNAAVDARTAGEWLSALPAFLRRAQRRGDLGNRRARVMDAELSMGTLVAFQALMAGLLGPVAELFSLGTTVQQTLSDLARLDDVLAHERDPALQEAEVLPRVRRGRGRHRERGFAHDEAKGRGRASRVAFGYSPLAAPLIQAFSCP